MRVSGGSIDGRLCDLLRGVQRPAIERANERRKVTVAADSTEAAAHFLQRGGDPAHEHPPVAPAADVARPLEEGRRVHQVSEQQRDRGRGHRLRSYYLGWAPGKRCILSGLPRRRRSLRPRTPSRCTTRWNEPACATA